MTTIIRVKEAFKNNGVAKMVDDVMGTEIRYGALGDKALLMAVMAQAYIDALRGDPIALAYFMSAWYRSHLAWCGLPLWWIPEGLERVPLE